VTGDELPTAVAVAAYLVLSIALWPAYRLISIPPFRREYFCLALRVAILIAAYFVALAALGVFLPLLVVPLAVVAAVLMVAERCRARAKFGRKNGLPPGSLTLVPRGPWVDDRFFAKQAEKHGSVFKMSQYFRPMVCVMGPREGLRLFQESSDRLIAPPVRFNAFIPNGFLRFMERPVHETYRPVFRRAFSKAVIEECKPCFKAALQTEISNMAAVSRAARGNGIHPQSYVNDIIFKLVVRLFIGVIDQSDEMERMKVLYKNVIIGKASCRSGNNDAAVNDAVADIILKQAAATPTNVPASFLAEIVRRDAEAVRDRTVVMNLVYMMQTVTSDLTGLITWMIKLLMDNPEWAQRLRTATESSLSEGDKVASLIVKESLRLERSEFIFRKTVAAIEFKGFTIPRNWLLRVCIRDGHRDPKVFPDPHTFNPERFSDRSYTREEYSPLGMGAHACLGEQVIYALAPAFLIEMTRSFEILKRNDGPREYGRSHWQPSSALRIEMTSR
jgi:cytochrome P450